jgi:NAD(P)-dependent dehydrogenase (short-subunit alcohol dehydrogenase family)
MAERPLEGQVALITGSAKRIGRSIALRLAREGASIVVNYATSRAEAAALVREIESMALASEAPARGTNRARLGGAGSRVRPRALAVQADVSRRASVKKLFGAIKKRFGRLDILVNNAGIFFPAKFEQLTDAQWDRIMDTNLKSQFLCAQAAAPIMKRQGRGRIVNISSLGGLLAWPAYTHYCVSKAGVIMLTRCLARALAPEILVNSVAPGTIQFPGELPDKEYILRVPLRRTGTGEDIADAVAYLVKADFVTGHVLAVDGGRLLV